MSKVPVFILNYNRLDLPRNMADYITECDGVYPIIIDNHSTYPKLIEYYKICPHEIIQMPHNAGNCAMWNTGLYLELKLNGNFIYTDPDLDLSGIPKDFLHVLQTGLDKYPVDKCGFSLEINNLPDNEMTREVHQWEDQNWKNPLDGMYFKAAIDTTFALYRTNVHSFNCIRTNRPYTAIHKPWTYTLENIPEDEKYYLESTGTYFNHWTNRLKKSI
jgi:hypothetical protein